MKEINATTQGVNGKEKKRVEALWMNDNFIRGMKTSKVQIELSEKEIKNRKVNPER